MANTYTLALDTLAERVKTFQAEKYPFLSVFSSDYSADAIEPGTTVKVKNVTAAAATVTNPTSFGGGDSTVAFANPLMNWYSQPLHISPKDYHSKLRLENLIDAGLNRLLKTISNVCTGVMTAANGYTTGVASVAEASFAEANRQAAWASIAKHSPRHLIISAVPYSKLAPSDRNGFDMGQVGAYGWDGIHLCTDWTGAQANTYGVAASPGAIAVAGGLVGYADPVRQSLESRVLTLANGLSVEMNIWVDLSTRNLNASLDVAFGAAPLDTSALTLIKSVA